MSMTLNVRFYGLCGIFRGTKEKPQASAWLPNTAPNGFGHDRHGVHQALLAVPVENVCVKMYQDIPAPHMTAYIENTQCAFWQIGNTQLSIVANPGKSRGTRPQDEGALDFCEIHAKAVPRPHVTDGMHIEGSTSILLPEGGRWTRSKFGEDKLEVRFADDKREPRKYPIGITWLRKAPSFAIEFAGSDSRKRVVLTSNANGDVTITISNTAILSDAQLNDHFRMYYQLLRTYDDDVVERELYIKPDEPRKARLPIWECVPPVFL